RAPDRRRREATPRIPRPKAPACASSCSDHRLVRDLESSVDNPDRLAQLRFGDAERWIRIERVPPHESVQPFVAKEAGEGFHLIRRAVERRERLTFRAIAHQL